MGQFKTADEFKAEDVDWLWRERIPRSMVSFIAGKPEQGKGLMACHIAAEVSKEGGKVLYSAAEDAEGLMTRPRLEAAGAVLPNVTLQKFILPRDLQEIGDFIIDQGIDLLIIDPLASHLQGVSRHSDNIRTVLNPLTQVLEIAECGCIVVEHVNKKVATGAHPLTAIGGSGSGLPAACRMGFFFGVDPENEEQRVLACVKSNICARPQAVFFEQDDTGVEIETRAGEKLVKQMPLLIVDREGTIDPIKLVASKQQSNGQVGRPSDKRAQAGEWLTKYLIAAGGPVPAATIYEDAKQLAMPERTLRRAAADMMIVRGEIETKEGKVATWDLSDDIKQFIAEAEESAESGDVDVGAEVVKATIVNKKQQGNTKKAREAQQAAEWKPPAKDEALSDDELDELSALLEGGDDAD